MTADRREREETQDSRSARQSDSSPVDLSRESHSIPPEGPSTLDHVPRVDGDVESLACYSEDSAEAQTEVTEGPGTECVASNTSEFLGSPAEAEGPTRAAEAYTQLGRATIRHFAKELLARVDDLHTLAWNKDTLYDFLTLIAKSSGEDEDTAALMPAENESIREDVSNILESAFAQTQEKYPPLPDDLSPLVSKLVEAFSEIQRDEQGLQRLHEDCARWSENRERLLSTICELTSEAQQLVDSTEILEIPGCSEEDRRLIDGRIEGIRLMLKMILLLPERASESIAPCRSIAESDFRSTTHVRESVAALLKDVSHHNYGLITGLRQSAERCRNSFFSFLGKHYFVILDSLQDGKRSSEDLKMRLTEQYPVAENAVSALFKLYDELIAIMERFLGNFNIVPIVTERGAETDYYLHEPFDVEADPELSTGQVLDMIHKGYEFLEKLHGERNHVVRRARVRVVKN